MTPPYVGRRKEFLVLAHPSGGWANGRCNTALHPQPFPHPQHADCPVVPSGGLEELQAAARLCGAARGGAVVPAASAKAVSAPTVVLGISAAK